MWIFGFYDEYIRQVVFVEIQFQVGFRVNEVSMFFKDGFGFIFYLVQCDLLCGYIVVFGQVVFYKIWFCDVEYFIEVFDLGFFFVLCGFQYQMDCINLQDIGDFVIQIFQEYFKFQRIQYVQNCVMYLIGVCQIFIGCSDYVVMCVFQLVKLCFKMFYCDVVQIDNIVVY